MYFYIGLEFDIELELQAEAHVPEVFVEVRKLLGTPLVKSAYTVGADTESDIVVVDTVEVERLVLLRTVPGMQVGTRAMRRNRRTTKQRTTRTASCQSRGTFLTILLFNRPLWPDTRV